MRGDMEREGLAWLEEEEEGEPEAMEELGEW